MKKPTKSTLQANMAYHPADDAFAANARLLQSLWARKQGLPMEKRVMRLKDGTEQPLPPLGNYVALDHATREQSSFLTANIRSVVVAEMAANELLSGAQKKTIRPDRLYGNLLSSQPMAFNLFGELKCDLELATRVFSRLFPDRIGEVTNIEFEHSPGRADPRFTEDRSAFDVFVEYTRDDVRGFMGIEVKYAENMNVAPAKFRKRYREVAEASQIFKAEAIEYLCAMPKPIEQLWRDHLLCLSMQPPVNADYDEGAFVFMYPTDNISCFDAVQGYRKRLAQTHSFQALTMEAYCDALRTESAGAWVEELFERYLAFARNGA